jgi:hypothetical protein
MSRVAKAHTLTLIAETNDRFADFAPYVASINDAGVVAFQATLQDGGSGIFAGSGATVSALAESATSIVARFQSHPDITREGGSCVYGALASGVEAVLFIEGGEVFPVAHTSGSFARIGPLGPTMNDGGAIAFRADLASGASGIFTWRRGDSLVKVADTTEFAAFHGLPVINGHGDIVFRADRRDGVRGIYISRGQTLETVIEARGELSDIGLFPCINDEGAVVFSAAIEGGGSGIFRASGGRVTMVVDTKSAFESFRGALINDAGSIFFYATPRGGQLGIHAAADPDGGAIVSIGDPLFDSTVVELALNPVSVNDRDQLAIRLRLASGRGLIVRADPA